MATRPDAIALRASPWTINEMLAASHPARLAVAARIDPFEVSGDGGLAQEDAGQLMELSGDVLRLPGPGVRPAPRGAVREGT